MKSVYYCKKHRFVVLDADQIKYCVAQNCHKGCKNLETLPAEHPKTTERKNIKKRERREARALNREFQFVSGNGHGC